MTQIGARYPSDNGDHGRDSGRTAQFRILLVEDEEVQARLLSAALEESDARFKTLHAATLRDAMDRVSSENLDAILLDINLPDSRSLATVERLRAIALAPIIVFTGESGLGELAIRAGADEYLVKGQTSPTAIRRAVIYAIERWRSRRELEEHAAMLEAEIAERIRIEEDLRRSESRLRAIVQSEPECVKAIGPDLTVLEMNPSGLDMLGVDDITQLRGRSICEFIHPDDHQAYGALHAAAMRGGSGTLQFRIVGQNGKERWVEAHSVPLFDGDDRPDAVLSVTRDITERKFVEDSLQRSLSLLEIASRIGRVGAWIVELPERSITLSEEIYEIFDAPRDFQPTVSNMLAFYTPEFRAIAQDAFDACVRDGSPFDLEMQVESTKGRRSWVRVLGEADRDAEGKVKAVLGALQDITERRNFEQQMLQAQRVESIGRLAGGIAHDINNLLMPILMGANLLKRTAPDANPRAIAMIEQSAKRGGELVSRIMSFARGDEGARKPLRLQDAVKEIEGIVTSTFPRHIAFSVDLPEDLWLIHADPTQIQQLLLNLCVNARDAMPSGGTITISARNTRIEHHYSALDRTMQSGPYVRLEVSDTGVGIAPEVRQRIFDPFFTTKQAGKGTGLGLSTVAAVARAHGGYITVHSRIGSGTTFEIYLPAKTNAVEQVPQPQESAAPQAHGELVLVVDDDPSVVTAVCETLRSGGYRVLTAEDGAHAVEVYKANRDQVAAIVVDLMMPVMDGASLIAALRNLTADVPIIATSGGETTVHVDPENSDVQAYLQKPYSADVLLGALRDALEKA